MSDVRAERRELLRERDRWPDQAVAGARVLEAARAEAERALAVRAALAEAGGEDGRVRAERALDAADRARAAAEQRAARGYRGLASAVTGGPRRLTAGELAELRRAGPSRPAVLAAALKELAEARTAGRPQALRAALAEVASAAVSWQERIH
ncbi:MAG TPA: hypothetical protein VHX88_15220 [Solirubrobacteraceae bacterium]|nr:hypothetical protein [Solirubrobacteraceae bacterium]